MTIGTIARQVAFYLQKTRATFVDEDGRDMIIDAMNHARKDAERGYDFRNNEAEAWLSVSAGAEASLTEAKLITAAQAFSTTSVKVKTVDTVYMGDDVSLSTYYPIYIDSKRLRAIKLRERFSTGNYSDCIDLRYRTSYSSPVQPNTYGIVYQGNRISFNPAFTTTKKLALDIVAYMDDYVQNRLSVLSSSTGSTAVTLNLAAPLNVVVGTTLLGRTVSAIATNRLSLTLSGNATSSNTNAWVSYTNTQNIVPGNGGEDYSDWFTECGSDYLLFGAMCHLNLFTQGFASQAQGYVPPPEKQRDVALIKIFTADALMMYQNRIGMRNR